MRGRLEGGRVRGGGFQAAEFVFVVGEFVGWGCQFMEGAEGKEELENGDG